MLYLSFDILAIMISVSENGRGNEGMNDLRVWSLKECVKFFSNCVKELKDRLSEMKEDVQLAWDKVTLFYEGKSISKSQIEARSKEFFCSNTETDADADADVSFLYSLLSSLGTQQAHTYVAGQAREHWLSLSFCQLGSSLPPTFTVICVSYLGASAPRPHLSLGVGY